MKDVAGILGHKSQESQARYGDARTSGGVGPDAGAVEAMGETIDQVNDLPELETPDDDDMPAFEDLPTPMYSR